MEKDEFATRCTGIRHEHHITFIFLQTSMKIVVGVLIKIYQQYILLLIVGIFCLLIKWHNSNKVQIFGEVASRESNDKSIPKVNEL